MRTRITRFRTNSKMRLLVSFHSSRKIEFSKRRNFIRKTDEAYWSLKERQGIAHWLGSNQWKNMFLLHIQSPDAPPASVIQRKDFLKQTKCHLFCFIRENFYVSRWMEDRQISEHARYSWRVVPWNMSILFVGALTWTIASWYEFPYKESYRSMFRWQSLWLHDLYGTRFIWIYRVCLTSGRKEGLRKSRNHRASESTW